MTEDEFREAVRDHYQQVLPDLEDVRDRLKRMLTQCIEQIGDRTLVRAEIRDRKHMIKSPGSLARKAIINGWGPQEALARAPDVVRGRVVCNNVADVCRFLEILRTQLSGDEELEVRDYIEEPKEGGYRGVHVRTRFRIGRPAAYRVVPVEIQVRTLLQDAWARLTHQDIYKESFDLPTDLRGRSVDLATVLAAADAIATRVRERVTEERIPPEKADLSVVSEDVLTFVYARKFGTNPPDYLVRSTVQRCEKSGLQSLDTLPRLLDDEKLRTELDAIVRSRFPSLGLTQERFFEAAIVALTEGRDAAIKFVSDRIEEEWQRVERIARDEALAEVPDTLGAFIEELESGRTRVDEIASLLGGKTHCVRCVADLIDPEAFEVAVLEHYGEEDTDPPGKIARIIQGSYNAPDYKYAGYCSYCANKWRKTLAE